MAALAQQAEAEALANQNAENSTNQNTENETSEGTEATEEQNDAKPKVDNENPEENKGKIFQIWIVVNISELFFHTIWKFNNFSATQILSEIKFWWFETLKNIIFGNSKGSEI